MHCLPVDTAVHTTPQKRRVEDKSKWKRARKRALGFKFLAELKPQEELCPPTCNFQCGKVPMAHRVALREQLNQEYKSRGKRGVSSFLNCLIQKKDTSKVRASRGYLTTRESAKNQVAGMRCKYCRLGIGTVAVGVVPLPRNHNFTALARRVLSRRKLPLDEAEETGETHAQVFPNQTPANRGAEIAKARGLLTMNKVKDHIKLFPREASHYSNDMNGGMARYFLSPDLFPAKLWQLFCHMHLPEFAQQAEKLGWWRSLDSDRAKPPSVVELETSGGVLLKPPLTFSWYLKLIGIYDLSFGQVKVDTCDKCDNFKHRFAEAPAGSEIEKKVSAEWDEHRRGAYTSYDSRNADANTTNKYYPLPLANDEKPAFNSLKKVETQTQDFGGNLRTPKLTVGEAYYLRILATFCYSIFSQARRRTVLYFWNEKIAEKGANNCVSIEHYQHLHYGSGATNLIKWYDGTFSQCNNGTMLRYNLEITDPDIPSMFMYQRMDVKIPPTGHTYLVNDSWFGSRFVKTTRTDSKYNKVNISEYHWFNYGVGEVIGPDGKQVLMADGSPQLQSHPGEVWMRKELNEKEPWVVLDLRRNAPRDHSKWGKGLRTRDLPAVDGVLPITDPKFQLYHAPLPITKEKIQDLHKLSKFLPDPAKAALYPPYVEGMLCKNNGSAGAAVEEPEEPEAPDELEEPVPAMPLATGLATAESSEDSSQSDDSGSGPSHE
ncbi:hypothetical protein CYMTET_34153 [Cymbomonas tetramitiformis]|uniref:Uncharacterized protein n=1 Tax=Cymbomonas tetramitiformis TaxID=36881 RepID=A0AAE0KQ51_9CHLO|nr:hypothetical protein CYMTET_34153 [Cymbomonas tetramitiformis]